MLEQITMRNLTVQKHLILVAGILFFAALAACNNAKSPDAVANDVAAARQKSANEVAKAQESAAKDADNATAKVNDKQGDLDATNAKGAYDVAIAKADGEHKVALEKCNALAGDAQKACKDQADARHELAEANSKAALAAQKP